LHQLTNLSMNFLKEVLNGENFSLSDYSLKWSAKTRPKFFTCTETEIIHNNFSDMMFQTSPFDHLPSFTPCSVWLHHYLLLSGKRIGAISRWGFFSLMRIHGCRTILICSCTMKCHGQIISTKGILTGQKIFSWSYSSRQFFSARD
jgi:hypothetical protein